MTVAYVVVSYRNPAQVLRLVSALREGPCAEVVVRHDQTSTRLTREDIEHHGGHALEDGIDVAWGEFSYVEVLLNAIEWSLDHLAADWVVVLSGQDYPVRPLADVERRLAGAEEDAFLTAAWELPTAGRADGPEEEFFLRYAYRHFAVPDWTPHAPPALRGLFYTREMPANLGKRVGLRRARLPFGPGRRCFVSADWLTLSARAARSVIAAARDERALLRHYRRSIVPSESFFATALLNDARLTVGQDRRFLSFGGPGVPHPDVLTSGDLDRLIGSGMDFARKFDAQVDSEVLDALDERRRTPHAPR